jgi:hypothetical protein
MSMNTGLQLVRHERSINIQINGMAANSQTIVQRPPHSLSTLHFLFYFYHHAPIVVTPPAVTTPPLSPPTPAQTQYPGSIVGEAQDTTGAGTADSNRHIRCGPCLDLQVLGQYVTWRLIIYSLPWQTCYTRSKSVSHPLRDLLINLDIIPGLRPT